MQGAPSAWSRSAREYPGSLSHTWMMWKAHQETETKVGEIISSNSNDVSVMVMFSRAIPSIETFKTADILSPTSMFIWLGARSGFSWLEIGSYVVNSRANRHNPTDRDVFDRIRDIYDGHVFLTVAPPVSLLEVNKLWEKYTSLDTTAPREYVNSRMTSCKSCSARLIPAAANTRPRPPSPTTARHPVDESIWAKLGDG